MKKILALLTVASVLGPLAPHNIDAATQVYDLKADWSDTQNPNGPWSYRDILYEELMLNDPFPWTTPYAFDGGSITKTTASSAVPGYLEPGDISLYTGSDEVGIRWTAPATGTISLHTLLWDALTGDFLSSAFWKLTHNGALLAQGSGAGLRSSPTELSFQDIPVQDGDQLDLSFEPYGIIGLNFTITLISDSVDPINAVEPLATTVVQMNLQNGIENSLDSKLDAALNVLTDVNVSNDGAACNSLAAFISAVEAQRGKRITNAQADQLISSAQDMKAALNCAP